MAEVKEWSNSSLAVLQGCGEKFRRQVLDGERVRPTFRMARGTVVHRTVSASMLRKMQDGTLPTAEEQRDVAAANFAAVWEQENPVADADDAEEAGGEKALRDDSKDFAVDISGLHLSAVAPAVNPVAVERTIIIRPQDSDLVIRGTLDLVDRQDVGEVIRDTKSTVKSPVKTAAADSQQFDMYGLIRYCETGALPAKYQLDFLVRTPARHELKHVPQETTRTAEDLQTMVSRINVAVEAVKRGVFVPANPDWWGCSAKWCQFHSPTDPDVKPCVYVKRGSRPRS